MDPATMAAVTVAAVSPYLVEVAKGAAGKVGEAAYEGSAKLWRFLKNKFTGGDEKALARIEGEPENADNQAALRIVLKEWVEREPTFRDELAALLNALPKTAPQQFANVVGDDNVVVEAAGSNTISIGGRK